jgi:hypothetical protein
MAGFRTLQNVGIFKRHEMLAASLFMRFATRTDQGGAQSCAAHTPFAVRSD